MMRMLARPDNSSDLVESLTVGKEEDVKRRVGRVAPKVAKREKAAPVMTTMIDLRSRTEVRMRSARPQL
jgi:hypothetical protein